MKKMTESEHLQKITYNKIASVYEAHNNDVWSQKYRHLFYYEPLFKGINLSGKKVLEAMCGSGQATKHLIAKGAKVTCLDISEKEIESVKRKWPQIETILASINNSGLKSDSFDCVVSIAGLHHLYPGLDDGISEIYRILKSGGYFCFIEPHRGSLPDCVRKYWYKHDRLFAVNETSIDLETIKKRNASRFNFICEKYGGNLSYLLVANSLAFRIPVKLKSVYSPILMPLEGIFQHLQGKRLSCFVLCQWQKK